MEAVNDSTLDPLDVNDLLIAIRDLKQEIYERFTITSKKEDDEDMVGFEGTTEALKKLTILSHD